MKPSPVIPYRPKLMKRILASTLLVLAGFMAVPVQADVPLRINYQGRVTDSTGALIGDGTPVNRKIIFRIWDHASNSTGRLWTEEQTVTIYNGDFSVLLGAGIDPTGTAAAESRPALDTVFAADGTDRFLEIMVDDGNNTIEAGDQPISPRQQITSTGYAFRAKFADNVATGTDLNLNGSNNYGLGWYGTGRQFANTSIDGPVLYGNAGGALGSYNGTTQTSALRWNAAGQVGVGSVDLAGMDATSKLVLQGNDSTAPPKQLTIRGLSDTNKRLYLGYNTSSNYGALQAYSGVSTTTNLLLNPSGGNVGIGTTTPGAKLHIGGSYPFFGTPPIAAQTAVAKTSTSTTGVLALATSDVANPFGVTFRLIGAAALANRSVALQTGDIDSADGGNLSLQYQGGNVGIGTTSPGYKLDVAGDIRGSLIVRQWGTYTNGAIYSDNNYGMLFRSAQANPNLATFSFANTSDAKIMTMLNDGRVGIGTTTPPHKMSVRDGNFYQDAVSGWQDAFVIARDGVVRAGLSMDVGGTSLNLYTGPSVATPRMTITAGGNVGIGTSTPTKGKVHIEGGGSAPFGPSYGLLLSYGAGVYNGTGTDSGVSLWASGNIYGNYFLAFSDERIKQVTGRSNSVQDLSTLLRIEITDYTYVDPEANGKGAQKKVIAQQVEKVFPQAVSRATNEVPDIYKKAQVEDEWIDLKTDLAVGERVRILKAVDGPTGMSDLIHEVTKVADGKFQTNPALGNGEVFVYGREVNDFRSVDYEAIAMLNVSATQQIKKEKDAEVKALQASVSERDEKISDLEKRVIELEAKDKARDAKLSAIETLLRSSGKATAQTASLKQGGGAE